MASDRFVDLNAITSDDYDEDTEKADIVLKSDTENQVLKYQPTREKMDEMRSNIDKMEALRTKDRKSIDTDPQAIVKEMDILIAETNTIAGTVKQELEARKEEITEMAKTCGGKSGTMQMVNNLYNTYLRRFISLVTEYKNITQEYKTEVQNRLRRHLKICNQNLTDTQVEAIVSSGQAQDVIQNSMVSGNLEDMVEDIEQRHQGILSLESQVLEVFELFQNLATMVDLQDEKLSIIENHVANTKACAEKAEINLEQAVEIKVGTAKRNLCIALICFICVLFVFGPLIFGIF